MGAGLGRLIHFIGSDLFMLDFIVNEKEIERSEKKYIIGWAACKLCAVLKEDSLVERRVPACSISHKMSKSDISGGEPVICHSVQHTKWVA